MSTIAAISTPLAVGGLSVIRISGENALSIVARMFHPVSGVDPGEMSGYTCAYGKVMEGSLVLDDAILTVFRAPRSYTGENVAELSCHGGLYIAKQVLRLALAYGAQLAAPGEFTKRAFLNGKLSLTQAEGVMDLIAAKGESEHRCAVALRDGAIYRRIRKNIDTLLDALSDLAAWADYPEEDIPSVSPAVLLETIRVIATDLRALADTYDYGRILREGINTVIVGRPNVGKSTLMNYLSGYQRSIVTEIAGTTRDVIEESVRVGDFVLRLSDTAGLRKTSDAIEKIGVEIAYQRLAQADLALAVFDSTEQLTVADFDLMERLDAKKTIVVLNKADGTARFTVDELIQKFPNIVTMSAKQEEGMDALQAALEKMFLQCAPCADSGILANERQKACLHAAQTHLSAAIAALELGEMLDAVTVLLDEAVNALLELTGEKATTVVVDAVFAKFCVGK